MSWMNQNTTTAATTIASNVPTSPTDRTPNIPDITFPPGFPQQPDQYIPVKCRTTGRIEPPKRPPDTPIYPRLISMKQTPARLWLAGALLAFIGASQAQKSPAEIPVETFFKRAHYTNMALSPNAERLAAAIPARGRDNLVIIDLQKRTRKVITGFQDFDVVEFLWINNDRLCFRAADGQRVTGEFNYLGTYCVDHDGENIRNFTK